VNDRPTVPPRSRSSAAVAVPPDTKLVWATADRVLNLLAPDTDNDVAVMACLEVCVRIVKATQGLTATHEACKALVVILQRIGEAERRASRAP